MQMFYGKLVGVLRKNISQLYTVRTMQTEEVERYKFLGAADNVRKNERFILRAVFTGLAVVSLISNIVIAVAVIPMGDQLLSSSIGMGDFIAFLQYSAITVSAFTTIGAVIIFAPRAKVSFNNFTAVMQIPEETDDSDSVDLDVKSHKIEFRDVTLESGNAKQLKNVNITFEAGSITAITGPTGCGKTCLLQTLIGNGKKQSGDILVDSIPLEKITQASIRRAVSYGFSDPVLFTSSVRENLSMYGVDEGDMDTALQMACVDFIDDTNARLDNAGGRLSGGQRARVALAGVLGKDAEIYIIDDCLRSLDKRTEETAIDNLRVLSEKATVILVSQRIRTLMLADKTIVIDEDGTVTQGNHEELMRCSEFYKELSNLQKWEVSADE
jgi:ABC-type multidrug transport system fused ATPase/permease subunit